ncbi:conserved hypothetical protein, partial [Perkinsus marinus ATCC 50983]
MSNPFGGEGGGGGDGSDNAADRPPEGASGNPSGNADVSPFGSADASPFGSADANPLGGADANPFGGAGEDSSNSAGRDALGSPNGALDGASRGVLDGVVSGQDGYPLSRAGGGSPAVGGFRGSPGEALDSGGVLDGPRRDSLDSLDGPGSTDRPTSTTSARPTALAGLPANVGIVHSLPTRAPSGSPGSGMNPGTRASPEGRPKRDLRTPLAENYRFTDKSLNPSLGEELEFAPDPWSDGMGGVTRKDAGMIATGLGNLQQQSSGGYDQRSRGILGPNEALVSFNNPSFPSAAYLSVFDTAKGHEDGIFR